MPTYSYACTQCGNRFDAVQAFTDDALTTCDQCSGRLRKLFGSVGVVFKGSGFYRTDSREAARTGKTATNGSSKSSSSAESTGSGSSDKSGSGEKTSTSGDKSGDKSKASAGSTTTASTSSTSS